MREQDIKVVWPDEYELTFPGETLNSLWKQLIVLEQFDTEDVPPSFVILGCGKKLTYNPYVFHSCYDEGRISEEEMLDLLEMKENNTKPIAAKRTSGRLLQ